MKKVTFSIQDEVDEALRLAAIDRNESVSRVANTYLTDHPQMRKYIDEVRAAAKFTAYAGGHRVRKTAVKSTG